MSFHPSLLWLWPFACLLALGFAGCPDDKKPTRSDLTELPDGETCEPGAFMSCVEDGAPPMVVCHESGTATFVQDCGHQCREATNGCWTPPVGSVCFPGEVLGCVVEGSKQAVYCNNSGTATVTGVCHGSDGLESQCRGGTCTECLPGSRKCETEQLTVQCNAAGDTWEPYQACNGVDEICTGQFCERMCEQNIKFSSYIGCDYWGVDLDNAFVPGGQGFLDAAGAQFAIVVSNPPDSPLAAVVSINQYEAGAVEPVIYDSQGNALPLEPLEPGELRVFRLPRRDVNGTTQAPLAYQVTSTVPIIAYQFNPLENEDVYSNDASLLLPSNLLGREYWVMTREQTFDTLRGFFAVVAVQPGETTVSVTTSGPTQVGAVYPGSPDEQPIPHMEPGETRIFRLQQFDVLNLETDRPGADLTGTRILADKRVAVFGGSEAANAPNDARCVDIDEVTGEGVCWWDGETTCRDLMDCVNAGFNTCCADHLEQQIFPVKTWGSSYIATKSWDRGLESDIWRILAAEDNTKIVLVPPQPGVSVPILNAGEWFEFESNRHFEVHAQDDKPILVGQFLAAQDAPEPNVGGVANSGDAGTGDPAFMLSVPVQQYREEFVILVPAEYEANYVNITAPTGVYVAIDDEEILPGLFELIGSGEYSVYRQRLTTPGTHTITSDAPAGVIVYGYDQYVSYAYTGGLDLKDINKETPFSGSSEE